MDAVASTTFRAHMKGYMDQVRDDAEPIMVTSKDPSANAVVVNVRDWDNLMENLHVYSNPYLVEKLIRGREEARAGRAQVHELIEAGDD